VVKISECEESMKKIIAIGTICMFLLTSFSVFVVAENKSTNDKIILDYIFDTPVIENVEIADTIYDQIQLNDAPNCGNLGEPSLPAKGVYVLIPQGEKVSSISVSHGEMINLGSDFLIEPVERSVPLSEAGSALLPIPDETIYSSNEPFPGKLFTEVGTYSFRGYEILVLRLHPVQYIPFSGELFYYPDLSVSVETVEDGVVDPLFRGLEKDRLEVMDKVDNSDMVSSYSLPRLNVNPPPADKYDLLIITSEELKDGFEPLALAHNATGVRTVIKTLSDIGGDSSEDIRDYIRDAYTYLGIEYVILGGDTNIIPAKQVLYEMMNNLTWIMPLFSMGPSDLYYGSLEENTWNIPETPYPTSKDLSFTDDGVYGSDGGDLVGPVEDYIFCKVGSSSMLWTAAEDFNQGECILTFDPPLNLSGMHWLNFYAKLSSKGLQHHDQNKVYVIFHSSDGSTINNNAGLNLERDKWHHNHMYLPLFEGVDSFNFNEVESISFIIETSYDKYIKNVRLDGIYFSDWCDEYWGELGEADLMAEVYVGRASVDNARDVNNFVSKTLSYMATDPNDTYLKKVLMAGEYLGFPNDAEFGGNFLDELINGCSKWGYTTVGIPSKENDPDGYDIDKLYDRDWPGFDKNHSDDTGWPKSEIINRINNNIHIINGDGHGFFNKAMKLQNSDVYSLKNNKPFFVYTVACLSGMFDTPIGDCFAEYITVKTKHGAFAVIMNARFGVGNRSTNAPSQHYYREFWDAVFGENIPQIGKANQDSKEDNLWRIDETEMRGVYLELTLFGDPSVDILNHFENHKPLKPDTPDGPTEGEANVEYNYTTCTTDPDGHQLQYGWDWQGDFIVDEWTDFYPSGIEVTVSHSWSLPGPRWIRVKAKDVFGAESEWSDPLMVTLPTSEYSQSTQDSQQTSGDVSSQQLLSSPTNN